MFHSYLNALKSDIVDINMLYLVFEENCLPNSRGWPLIYAKWSDFHVWNSIFDSTTELLNLAMKQMHWIWKKN